MLTCTRGSQSTISPTVAHTPPPTEDGALTMATPRAFLAAAVLLCCLRRPVTHHAAVWLGALTGTCPTVAASAAAERSAAEGERRNQ